LPPHGIAALMHYTLESHRAEPLSGAGPIVVDISDTLEAKLEAVRCYHTQFPPEKEHIFLRIEAIARQLGHAAGFAAGELLVHTRALGTRNLMTTLFDDTVS